MLRLLTAGESHGPKLTVILDGMPAGLNLDFDFIKGELKARQGGFGRSGRQKLEQDAIDITGGVRHGATTGAPLCFEINNKEHLNWLTVMSTAPLSEKLDEAALKQIKDKTINRLRPGHADFAGTVKYKLKDVRDTLERSSARETAARVGAGALCQLLLRELGVEVASHVVAIGKHSLSQEFLQSLKDLPAKKIKALARESQVYCPDSSLSLEIEEHIRDAIKDGDSLGGVVQVVVDGLPPGLGSAGQWDRKLDGLLAQALMSVQSAKAVEIGEGVKNAALPGSMVHDSMRRDDSGESPCYHVKRETNRAGGLEGGMTNGERLIVRAYFKPIPTMKKGLPSLSFPGFQEDYAHYERSDACAVPAASVVAAAMVSLTLANAFIDKFACDSMVDLINSVEAYRKYVFDLTKGDADAPQSQT